MVAMVSLSKDGDLQHGILSRLGIDSVRGSSSRQGSCALRALVRRLKQGSDGAFAVDGPKGPIGVAKPGVILASRLSGVMIIPISASARWGWTFLRAWDRYLLPLPFSKVVLMAAEPLILAPDAPSTALEQARANIEQTLKDLTAAADLRMGRTR